MIRAGIGSAILAFADGTILPERGYVNAQINPDNSLGAEQSIVTPNTPVRGLPADLIQGGANRGVNLFHSFLKFNVGDGQRVYFANPAGIENILGRVTGADPSKILGTLGVNGGANLFLLNPNGIIFGPNARLDVAGSFVATTANSFKFPNGSEFSATNPQAPPLLTINITPGLQYGPNHQATITNSSNLTVGQDLTLAAGNLDLQGQLQAGGDLTLSALDTVQVRDSVTAPFVAAAQGNLTVQGNQRVDIFVLNHPNSGFMSGKDLVLRSSQPMNSDAHFWSGGNVRFERLDGSPGNWGSTTDPIIFANGDISFGGYTGASLHILAGGSVTSTGDIIITDAGPVGTTINPVTYPDLANVTTSDGTALVIDGSSRPTLDIRAGIDWAQLGGAPGNTPIGVTVPPSVFGTSATSANISVNNITLAAPDGLVFLSNQFQPNRALPSGNISVRETTVNTNGFAGGGNSGAVLMDARANVTITDSTISASSSTFGNTGRVTLLAGDTVSLSGSSIFSRLLANGIGKAEGIRINTGSLIVTNGGRLLTSTFGQGDAGDIIINARDLVSFDGQSIANGQVSAAFTSVEQGGRGQGGNIDITTGTLSVTNGASLVAVTRGQGDAAGNVIINARGRVSFDGTSADGQFGSAAFSNLEGSDAMGKGGDVRIFTTGSVEVSNGAQLQAQTEGTGNAGNVIIDARDSVVFKGTTADGQRPSAAFSKVQTGAIGRGGDVRIFTGSLEVLDGAQLQAQTEGMGNAGNVIIEADRVSFSGINAVGRRFRSGAFSNVEQTGRGQGGNVDITTGTLSVTNGALLSANLFGQGAAGNVIIDARNSVVFKGTGANSQFGSTAISNVEGAGAIGKGGDVRIFTTGSVEVSDGAQLQAQTEGTGNAGNVIIKAHDSVIFNGASADGRFLSTAFSRVDETGRGQGGNVEITTGSLSVTNGARLTASTLGQGNAGNVIIKAHDSVSFRGSSTDGRVSAAFSTVSRNGKGQGGNVEVKTGILSVTNGAQLTATTFGEGNAGSVIIKADRISFAGISPFADISTGRRESSGAFSAVGANATGQAGNVQITAGNLSITNRAVLSTSSSGSGDGGNIDITARSVRLDRGLITAATASSDGGDITLNVRDILSLRRGSFISTRAGTAQAGGDGGNIRINTSFLVTAPLENNDILANAFNGRGGNVTINAQGIYWFTLRSRDDLARLLGTTDPLKLDPRSLPTNDISAISQSNPSLNGIVTLNTPDIDPSRGLVSLPVALIDPSQQIDRRCQPGSAQSRSSFVITGRGGLASSPTDPLQSEEGLTDWVLVEEGKTEDGRETSRSAPAAEIVEATHLIREPDGTIALVAADSQTGSPEFWRNPAACLGSQSRAR